jgi:hypothetical protein
MAQAPVSLTPRRKTADVPVRLDRLAECVRRLDPATRALLDLSVRRGVRDDQMAPILRTDPFHLAWRRARALEQVASELGDGELPAPLGEVRMALEALPREAWGLPGMGPPALPPGRSPEPEPEPVPEPVARVSDVVERPTKPAPPPDSSAGSALVPATSTELAAPAPSGRLARLDAFASESPPLGLALRQLGRAIAAKAVRLVVWRRSH